MIQDIQLMICLHLLLMFVFSSKISQIFQPQVSFLSGVSPTSTVNPSSNILYVGVDGSSYVWNGSVYNNVL